MYSMVVTFFNKEDKKTYEVCRGSFESKQEWINVSYEVCLKGLTLQSSPYTLTFLDDEGLPYYACKVPEVFVMETLLDGEDSATALESAFEKPYTVDIDSLKKGLF